MRARWFIGLCLAFTTTAGAQVTHPYTDGLNVAVYTAAVSMRDDGPLSDGEFGVVLGGALGYGVSRYVGVFFGVDVGQAAPSGGSGHLVGHADLGVRLSAATHRRTVPYADLAFSGFGTEVNGRQLLGNAFTVGAGLELFRTQRSSIDFGVRYSRGELDDDRASAAPRRASTTRLMLGLRHRPPREVF